MRNNLKEIRANFDSKNSMLKLEDPQNIPKEQTLFPNYKLLKDLILLRKKTRKFESILTRAYHLFINSIQ